MEHILWYKWPFYSVAFRCSFINIMVVLVDQATILEVECIASYTAVWTQMTSLLHHSHIIILTFHSTPSLAPPISLIYFFNDFISYIYFHFTFVIFLCLIFTLFLYFLYLFKFCTVINIIYNFTMHLDFYLYSTSSPEN